MKTAHLVMGLVQNRKNEISSTAVDMIHAQKFNCCFSTTYTFSLIMSLFNSESDPGTYDIINKAYDTKEARITVLDNETSDGDLILGGFYTPTRSYSPSTESNRGYRF
ncbi:MAG: hypothetical protein WBL44_11315 [Nitrososphaeraceae archaeon]|jgi:hypothetical protein